MQIAKLCCRLGALQMPGSRLACLLLLAQLLFLPGFLRPQAAPAEPKLLKVGLVLEGGGALGLAHIGVLKWLDEHHIPITYIAGTSMGGLVSGIYATGHNPAEIETLIEEIKWDQVLRDHTPFEELSYRRKEDAVEFPTGLEFGLRHGVQLPSGFNSGQQVNFILDKVALPFSEVKSFNDLPTPFACVATDLVTGKPHVFRDGSLALALRSTMSLPGIFSPVRSGDHIYADGGLTNNLPVDVAQEMGADFTIAVFLKTAPLDPKTYLSSFGVAAQSIGLMIAANETAHKQMANILINVPLDKYTTMDYSKSVELVSLGYQAAESNKVALLRLVVDDAVWHRYIANRESKRMSTPVPQFVEVTGASPRLNFEIEKHLAGNIGVPISTPGIEKQITQITGAGRFSSLSYAMTQRNGKPGLLIIAEEKQYAPPTVRPLIVIDGSSYNNVLFSAGVRITFLDFGAYGAEWRNDIIVGSQYKAHSEYYLPLNTTTKWFVAPQILLDSEHFNVYDGQTLIAEYRRRQAGGGFDLGYAMNSTSELRMGYKTAYEHFSSLVGQVPGLPNLSGRQGTTTFRYNLDATNDAVLPTKGISIVARGEWWDSNPLANKQFPLVEIQTRFAKPVNRIGSVLLQASGGSTLGYQKTGIPMFSLGGMGKLAVYGENQFLTNQYYLFQIGYIRQIAKLPPLIGDTVSFVSTYEIGKIFYNGNTHNSLPMDGVVGIVAKTILGPMQVAGAFGDGQAKVFFQVARIF